MTLKPNTTITSLCILIGTIAMLYSCGDTKTEPPNDNAMQTAMRSCSEIPTVALGGKTYNTIQIGDQCWFQENVDIGISIRSDSSRDIPTDNGTIEKYCYDNTESNCDTYGGLYNWNEAMHYVATEGAQGICPPGWHIPTNADFETLDNAVGGRRNTLIAVGQNPEGTNISGFSALFAGYRDHNDGQSHGVGNDMIFWSSTSRDRKASTIEMYNNIARILFTDYDKTHGFTVRCLKDEAP